MKRELLQRGGGVEEAYYAAINTKCERPNQWRGCTSREADAARLGERNTDVRAWVGSAQFLCYGYVEAAAGSPSLHGKHKIKASNII